MAEMSESQLQTLCAALGWQGGTYWQVVDEIRRLKTAQWRPIETAPKEQGSEVLGWFRKVKLDEDDNLTDEVIGGAIAQVSRNGDGWNEPDWLNASGAYFFDDWSFEPEPVLWHPLPAAPDSCEGEGRKEVGSDGVKEPLGDKNG
jgi:hypothetical protein